MSPKLRSYKVIAKELKPFLTASGAHQKRVRESLNRLQSGSSAVFEMFEQRRVARAEADSEREKKTLQDARDALEMQKKIHKSNIALGDAELTRTSKIFLEIAQGGIRLAKDNASWQRAVSRQADTIDLKLESWMDELVALSASAVSDDAALEKALALASGALILAGVLGGPATVLGAAVGSAALLARDVMKSATKSGRAQSRDQAELREQKAVVLMDQVSGLCERWKTVLKPIP